MMDLINGLFELCASLFILNNCRVLYVQKQVRGISIISTIFFTLWGLWNVFYYPHLGQMLSFYAGVGVLFCNILWVSMMVYYTKKGTLNESH